MFTSEEIRADYEETIGYQSTTISLPVSRLVGRPKLWSNESKRNAAKQRAYRERKKKVKALPKYPPRLVERKAKV